MKKLFYAAFTYMLVGVVSGLYYREFTKLNDFALGEYTQLGVVHTHLLTLGFIILLVVLALEKLFGLSRSRLFGWFFWVYNAGIILTTAMMLWHGSLTVLGQEGNGMISGIAGLGHILLTAGMVLLFLSLRRGLVLDGVIHDPASAYAANSQAAKADANNTGAVA